MIVIPDKLKAGIEKSIQSNQALLVDFDGTLVDYKANESNALERLFEKLSIPNELHKKAKEVYSEINSFYWTQFEQKKLSIEEVQLKRFDDLCKKFNILADTKEINKYYLESLVLTTKVEPEIINALKSLKELGLKLIIITNGVHWTQTERLKNSGIMNIVDNYFTSESVGHAKPHPKMFEDSKKFLESINCSTENLWVIGDNLDADIRGAYEVGLQTCWISNNNVPNEEHNPFPTLTAHSFLEFVQLYKTLKTKN